MNLDLLLLLLVSIKNNKNSNESLLTNRFKYIYSNEYEIGMVCNYALENALIRYEYEGLVITPAGIKKINEINDSYGRKGIERCIIPYSKYKTKKISTADIYIPKKR